MIMKLMKRGIHNKITLQIKLKSAAQIKKLTKFINYQIICFNLVVPIPYKMVFFTIAINNKFLCWRF